MSGKGTPATGEPARQCWQRCCRCNSSGLHSLVTRSRAQLFATCKWQQGLCCLPRGPAGLCLPGCHYSVSRHMTQKVSLS